MAMSYHAQNIESHYIGMIGNHGHCFIVLNVNATRGHLNSYFIQNERKNQWNN